MSPRVRVYLATIMLVGLFATVPDVVNLVEDFLRWLANH